LREAHEGPRDGGRAAGSVEPALSALVLLGPGEQDGAPLVQLEQTPRRLSPTARCSGLGTERLGAGELCGVLLLRVRDGGLRDLEPSRDELGEPLSRARRGVESLF